MDGVDMFWSFNQTVCYQLNLLDNSRTFECQSISSLHWGAISYQIWISCYGKESTNSTNPTSNSQ